MKIYLIGSLRNRKVQDLAVKLRALGHDVFDDWQSPGAQADEEWQKYERKRGRSYKEALYGHHATTVFELDKNHLEISDVVVMVKPAGNSAAIELGWAAGRGILSYVLFDAEPDRYDIMYRFATDIFFSEEELLECLKR